MSIPTTTTTTSTNQSNMNYIHSVLLSFVPVSTILFVYFFISPHSSSFLGLSYVPLMALIFLSVNVTFYRVLSPLVYFRIYWRSSLLANLYLVGFMLANQEEELSVYVPFGYYLMSLTFFHMSEFVSTALFNQADVSTDSFLLNHSLEYGVAAAASWTEFFLESLVAPSLKTSLYTRLVGLSFIVFGEIFRKLAMYTAGSNFNHFVQETRQSNHELVTKGIYRFVRHPSYFGWFYWSIGTQILLGNPLCAIAYTVVTWKFFASRIAFEEYYLIRFFGKDYLDYQKKVPSGIPFVKGFVQVEEKLD
jgi:protein-S-isoprenylcysteine O-methyltransferase